MNDFLLELLSEEIPARMQEKACADLARLFTAELAKAGLAARAIETYATPRRLALIARDLPPATEAVREETKGPRASAPPQALEGFLRKTGLTADRLAERDGILYAVVEKPGRATADVLAEAIPAVIRAFPWPKSMRWGAASAATASLRWVRPLQGIVALFGEDVVPFEVEGVASGAATVGHRFHHPGAITIGSAADYAGKLRLCHVILDPAERRAIIESGARTLAEARDLRLVPDAGLVAENAGLTEWPVPLLGDFDPAFLEVPREVIQLTMRTNQKYFALNPPRHGEGDHAQHGGGGPLPGESLEAGPPPPSLRDGPPPRAGEELAPYFICTANIDAADGGARVIAGNRKVLAARLADARFFWEQDLKVPLEEQARKLDRIVFHEKLGTVADKVERVAKLARWLVEEGIVDGGRRHSASSRHPGAGRGPELQASSPETLDPGLRRGDGKEESAERARLADLAEQAARLCKADLVTGMVGEFPELQGVMGGHYARHQGLDAKIADAIRDHYKPVGPGDDVPTAPVTVAVSLADKLDTILTFFASDMRPSGSKDPFALRRSALGVISLLLAQQLRLPIRASALVSVLGWHNPLLGDRHERLEEKLDVLMETFAFKEDFEKAAAEERVAYDAAVRPILRGYDALVLDFFADRLKVQQREAGVRHDLIDAVFALGEEDDLVRLLARVKALQAFVETGEGANLLAGYKRAANILKKEGWDTASSSVTPAHAGVQGLASGDVREKAELDPGLRRDDEEGADEKSLSYTPEPREAALIAALDAAEGRVEDAVAAERFEEAMAALAALRAPIDAFFEAVTVNDPDPARRAARLALLARIRGACHKVADFSRIEG